MMSARVAGMVTVCAAVTSTVLLIAACASTDATRAKQGDVRHDQAMRLRERIAQLTFGRDAHYALCIEPACPRVTPKTVPLRPEPASVIPVTPVPVPQNALQPAPQFAPMSDAPAMKPTAAALQQSGPVTMSAVALPAVSETAPAGSEEKRSQREQLVVLFAFGKSELTQEGRSVLYRAMPAARVSDRIVISGRTDDVGDATVNQSLALTRAIAVRNYLREAAPDMPGVISIDARGKCCFVASNDTAQGRGRNRRVEVTFNIGSGGGT